MDGYMVYGVINHTDHITLRNNRSKKSHLLPWLFYWIKKKQEKLERWRTYKCEEMVRFFPNSDASVHSK